jgi:hypothetical protein
MMSIIRRGRGILALFFLSALAATAAQYELLTSTRSSGTALRQAVPAKPAVLRAGVKRERSVTLPQQVGVAGAIVVGDTLAVSLFDGVAYTAIVDRVDINQQGTVSIRGRFPEFPMGSLLLASREGRSLISLEIPERAQLFSVVCDPATLDHQLLDLDSSRMDVLKPGPAVIPPRRVANPAASARTVSTALPPVLGHPGDTYIDLMIVYTPAARTAAIFNGGIDLVISMAMAKAQLALDNSLVGVTMQLVHNAQINYAESGDTGTDLDLLQGDGDGVMDEVHTWRDDYGADIVTMLADVEDVGGVGYLLDIRSGNRDYAFNVCRVQQSAGTYTVIHEIGHNMGCSHHKQQLTQPGPTEWEDWPENTWSAGWRWIGTNIFQYCSIMTYDSEDAFPDGTPSIQVPYFSNPTIIYEGQPTGHPADGDNARTIREVKTVISQYSTTNPDTLVTLTVNAAPPAAGTTSGSGQYVEGASVLISATAQGTWTFVRWNDGDTTPTRLITVPAGGATYTAYFAKPSVALPGPVALITPIGGMAVSTNPPVLQWSIPTPAATHYFVEINLNNVLYLQQTTTNNTLAVNAVLPPGNYQWRVRPWNSAGNGYWTGWGSFYVSSTVSGNSSARSSFSLFYQKYGTWYVQDPLSTTIDAFNWGWSETTPVPGDYDGDGIEDPAVYHRAAGNWYVIESRTGAPRVQNWGWSEAIPVPGDYDGDGKTDFAVYHRAAGNWFVLASSTGVPRTQNWGWSEAIPVPGDYDGDGMTDMAVYHLASGNWYVLASGAGTVRVQNWGWSEAWPAPGDYDGDGKTDLAVYHKAAGNWYVIESATGTPRSQNWGWSKTDPVPGDYDSDGKTDMAVFDKATGNWYVLESTTGMPRTQNIGGVGALPSLPQYWLNRVFGLD